MDGRIYYSQEAEEYARDREMERMIMAFTGGLIFGLLLLWIFAPRS